MTKYSRKEKPENIWELFGYILFDLKKAESWEKKHFTWSEFFKYYIQGSLIIILIWLVLGLLYTLLDIPTRYPDYFKPEYLKVWANKNDFFSHYVAFIMYHYEGIRNGLVWGLVWGLHGIYKYFFGGGEGKRHYF